MTYEKPTILRTETNWWRCPHGCPQGWWVWPLYYCCQARIDETMEML